jgi:hypothetical protein
LTAKVRIIVAFVLLFSTPLLARRVHLPENLQFFPWLPLAYTPRFDDDHDAWKPGRDALVWLTGELKRRT